MTVSVDGTSTTYAETADTTSEAYSFVMLHSISSTIFSGGTTSGWSDRTFELTETLNQADTKFFTNTINITYDASFPTTAAPAIPLQSLMRHGDWFNASGVRQPFSF